MHNHMLRYVNSKIIKTLWHTIGVIRQIFWKKVNVDIFPDGLFPISGHAASTQCMMTSSNGNIFCVTGHLCGELFPAQRPVTLSFHVFFDLRLNKPLSKQWWGWWFETLSRPLWRHYNESNELLSHMDMGGQVHRPGASLWFITIYVKLNLHLSTTIKKWLGFPTSWMHKWFCNWYN